MKIAIIGAGPTGLAAGYELLKKGHEVVIFEKEPRVGGLIQTAPIGQTRIENFCCHTFLSDNDLHELISEVGLTDQLIWKAPKNGFYTNQTLFPFTSPLDLINFKPLPFLDRIKLGLLVLQARSVSDWRLLDKMTAREWVIIKAGKKVYDTVWGPLLSSKFDLDADRISAAWLVNKLKLRGSSRRGAREVLGYLKGSFGLLYETLAEKIKKMGGKIHRSSLPERLFTYDAVIATLSPSELLNLGLNFPPEYEKKLKPIKYKANLCLRLELGSSLSPYYWISIGEAKFPFVSIIEHTNLMPEEEYGSKVVFISRYIDAADPLYNDNDEKITGLFLKYLKIIFPHFSESAIKKASWTRTRYAQPVIFTGYREVVPDFKTPIPRLYLASMAQIYPEDRGQNYAVRMGKSVAQQIGL